MKYACNPEYLDENLRPFVSQPKRPNQYRDAKCLKILRSFLEKLLEVDGDDRKAHVLVAHDNPDVSPSTISSITKLWRIAHMPEVAKPSTNGRRQNGEKETQSVSPAPWDAGLGGQIEALHARVTYCEAEIRNLIVKNKNGEQAYRLAESNLQLARQDMSKNQRRMTKDLKAAAAQVDDENERADRIETRLSNRLVDIAAKAAVLDVTFTEFATAMELRLTELEGAGKA